MVKRKGYVEPWKGADGKTRYRARIRLGDGSRTRIPCPEGMSEERAREFAAAMQEQEDAKGKLLAAKIAQRDVKPENVSGETDGDAWFDAWERSRVSRGLTSTADNRAHYAYHIRIVTRGKHVRDWTTDDLRAIVEALDEKIAARTLSPKSASNVWGTATKMVTDAAKSKVAGLRVRADNPARDVEGPDGGDRRAKQFLYPSEFLQLMTCDAVPVRWRRAVALAIYLFPRAGELRALQWDAVDLEHGVAHIHESFERRSRKVKATKTKKARRITLDPAIVPLLEAMHRESGGKGRVMPIYDTMAGRLREWLTTAGITRRELLDATSRTTKPLSWHDLRATGLTWAAVRGDNSLVIMQRAGHDRFETTQGYIRTAEALRAGFGSPFPALPASVVSPPTEPTDAISARDSSEHHGKITGEGRESTAFPASIGGADVIGERPTTRSEVGGLVMGRVGGPGEGDPIDRLTRAVAEASSAGQWDVVKACLEELRVLRLASAGPNVVALDVKARGRR